MKRAGNLLPKIAEIHNLREAFLKASRGKRGKREVVTFRADLDKNLQNLREQILNGSVSVGNFHTFEIRDPKPRKIYAAAFPERVLHHAIIAQCEPTLERAAIFDSYACRVGKGREAALDRAQYFARRNGWYLQMDVRKYFDSIDHAVLKAALSRRFKDKALLALLTRIIDSYQTSPGKGLPIGSLTSQHFANFYLSPLDRYVRETLRLEYIRYMDDFVCWAADIDTLKAAHRKIKDYARDSLWLEIKSEIRLNRSKHGLTILGYRVLPTHLRLSPRSAQRFRRRLDLLETAYTREYIDAKQFQQRSQCLCAFTMKASSWRWRTKILLDRDTRLQPREPRRQLEQQCAELPVCQSQQEHADEPEQQPRLSPGSPAQPDGRMAIGLTRRDPLLVSIRTNK